MVSLQKKSFALMVKLHFDNHAEKSCKKQKNSEKCLRSIKLVAIILQTKKLGIPSKVIKE